MTIFIAGLGLIGGSIAKKLSSLGYTIYAYTKNEDDIKNALTDGAIHKGYTKINEDFNADVVILAVPPHLIVSTAKMLLPHFPKDTVFTDVGSIKGEIEREMDLLNINYVGGHPMAGTEKKGYQNSFPHLFENAYYFITKKNPLVEKMVNDLGATPVFCDSDTHDKTVAVISHIPHAVSAALVNLAINNETNDKMLSKTAAGGFRDTTRISSSDENLWNDILFANKKYVVPLLSEITDLLTNLKNNIENHNSEDVLSYFKDARLYRNELQENRQQIGKQYYDIYVNVADKVGVISDISKILTDNNINIKNIGILNSREQIGGSLILSVYSLSDYNKSKLLLKDKYDIWEK